MSGIEAVGLALGLWPVVKNIVELYKASKDGTALKSIVLTIKTQELMFKQSISKLLQADEELSERDRAGLLSGDSDFTELWKDKEFVCRLRRRLGPELFTILEHKTETIANLLRALEKKIGSTEEVEQATATGTSTWRTTSVAGSSRSARERLHLPRAPVRSVKFILSKDDIKKSLETLKQHVQELRTVLEPCSTTTYAVSRPKEAQGHARSDSSEKRQRRIDAQFFNDFYKVLCQSFRCQCSVAHECSLRMSDLLQLMIPVASIERVMSSASELASDGQVTEFEDTGSTSDVNRSTWSRPKQEMSSQSSSTNRALLLSFSPTRGVRDLSSISDFCQFVRTLRASPPNSPSGDLQGMLCQGDMRYTVNAARSRDPLGAPTIVSMDDYLSGGVGYGMSRRMRLDLALDLTSAIGWFHTTYWIDNTWTWKSFSVVRGEQGESMHQLCITRQFYSPEASKQNTISPLSRFWHTMRQQLDPMLVRLGFALIELALGKRLSEIRSAMEEGKNDAEAENEALKDMEDYNTAVTLLDSGAIANDAGVAYHAVVSACVHCAVMEDVGMRSLKSGSPTFDDDLEKFVVGPLRKYHVDTWGQLSRLGQITAY